MTTVCPERELLPEYLTERLPPADAARLQGHLAGCDVCRRLADELEIGLAALAIARDEAMEQEQMSTASGTSTPVTQPAGHQRRRRPRWIAPVAAACSALILGGAVGAALERRAAGPDILATIPLTNTSVIDPAAGTATLALVDGGLEIGLELSGLPGDGDYYECVWQNDGEIRSAGTFNAVDGVVDVDLVVAPFEGVPTWTLDIVAHTAGEEPRIVLTAER